MAMFSRLITALTPLFLVLSPILSYADQILSIHRNRSSLGFSLDIPLIMLVASILKIFYWPGAHYDQSLLVQAIIMVVVQAILLKVALDHRPIGKGTKPFDGLQTSKRPFRFWRWQSQRPYWEFLGLLTLGLLACHTYIHQDPDALYTQTIGYVGLAIEAMLPLPQMLANHQARSCKGFRLSVLLNWLVGDAMKMSFFFVSPPGKIPTAFKLCAFFQAGCDVGLGLQYCKFGAESTLNGAAKFSPQEKQRHPSIGKV